MAHPYYASEKWRYIRKQVKLAAGNRCQLCNDTGKLEVHHRTYSRFQNENLGDLVALCPSCHRHFHNKIPTAPEIVQMSFPFDKAANED